MVVNDVTNARQMACMDQSYKIRGEIAKSKGNIAIGITMINKTRYMSVSTASKTMLVDIYKILCLNH